MKGFCLHQRQCPFVTTCSLLVEYIQHNRQKAICGGFPASLCVFVGVGVGMLLVQLYLGTFLLENTTFVLVRTFCRSPKNQRVFNENNEVGVGIFYFQQSRNKLGLEFVCVQYPPLFNMHDTMLISYFHFLSLCPNSCTLCFLLLY